MVRDFAPLVGLNLVQHSKLQNPAFADRWAHQNAGVWPEMWSISTTEVGVRYDTPKINVCWKGT